MAATIGIQGISDVLMQSFDVNLECSVTTTKKKDGSFHQAYAHSLKGTFSGTTLGSGPTLRSSFAGPKISGLVIVNEITEENKNDEFPVVKFSGEFYPTITSTS